MKAAGQDGRRLGEVVDFRFEGVNLEKTKWCEVGESVQRERRDGWSERRMVGEGKPKVKTA